MAVRNAALTSRSGSARPAVNFWVCRGEGTNLSECQGRTAPDARIRVLDRLAAGQPPAGRSVPMPRRSDRCGCLSDEGHRATAGRRRSRLAKQERGMAGNSVIFAVKRTRAPAPSAVTCPPLDEQIDHGQPDLSSSCRRFSLKIGNKTSSGSRILSSDLTAAARTCGAASACT